jgi:hypothetical protein
MSADPPRSIRGSTQGGRLTRVVPAALLLFALACGSRSSAPSLPGSADRPAGPPSAGVIPSLPPPPSRSSSPPRAPRATLPAADVLPAVADLPADQRAVQVVGGSERTVAVGAAHAGGLTVVDLSDAWVPSVIDDHAGPKGTTLVNPYHAIYVGLAADRTDGDGQPLAAGERNYLELYGIPPSLSVLRRRFLEDARRDCAAAFDPEKLLAVDEVRTWGASTEAKELGKQAARGTRLEAARVAAGAATLEALAALD